MHLNLLMTAVSLKVFLPFAIVSGLRLVSLTLLPTPLLVPKSTIRRVATTMTPLLFDLYCFLFADVIFVSNIDDHWVFLVRFNRSTFTWVEKLSALLFWLINVTLQTIGGRFCLIERVSQWHGRAILGHAQLSLLSLVGSHLERALMPANIHLLNRRFVIHWLICSHSVVVSVWGVELVVSYPRLLCHYWSLHLATTLGLRGSLALLTFHWLISFSVSPPARID